MYKYSTKTTQDKSNEHNPMRLYISFLEKIDKYLPTIFKKI